MPHYIDCNHLLRDFGGKVIFRLQMITNKINFTSPQIIQLGAIHKRHWQFEGGERPKFLVKCQRIERKYSHMQEGCQKIGKKSAYGFYGCILWGFRISHKNLPINSRALGSVLG